MTDEIDDPVVQSKLEIDNFIRAIEAQNFVQAERHFNDLLGQRIGDALDQSKAKIASQVFGDDDEEEEEYDGDEDADDEITDEEIEDAIDDEEYENEDED